MFHGKVVEKIKAYVFYSKIFRKSCHLWDNVEKYGTFSQATYDKKCCASKLLSEYRIIKAKIQTLNEKGYDQTNILFLNTAITT